uniref:legumain n=1 Tax=Tetranychus urticae TaxID=32264 RepID=T1JRE6_TETUR
MKLTLNLVLLTFCVTLGSTRTFLNQLPKDGSKIHAVIVAAAGGIENYLLQANTCHAYHILRSRGVPAENIIHMMPDDIANNPENPVPGKIFNEPNGTDVYAGCAKDYTGDEVNPENFMKILKGDKELAKKGKKVLTAGPEDHVLVYFNDHGDTGIICFPESVLTSDDLNKTITYMHQHQLYGKLTFYLVTCNSGSMFENILSPNINVYGVSSAKPDEPTYESFCDEPNFPFCLSDQFSYAWFKDTEHHDPTKETLETQYEDLVKKVEGSTPQQYGAKDIANEVIGEFEGDSKSSQASRLHEPKVNGLVSRRDAPLHYWRRRLKMAKDNEVDQVRSKLSTIVEGRRFYDRAIRNVINELCRAGFCSNANDVLSKHLSLFNHKAYSLVAKKFHSSCINLGVHSYALNYMYALANIIELQDDKFELQKLMHRMSRACAHHIGNHGFDAIV